jgi:hypothetical protein
MDIKIVIATHKNYWLPNDPCFLPLQVGKVQGVFLGCQGDDSGENISDRNAVYHELTGLYWAWKNVQADYLGLCHYRRYFAHTSWGFDLPGKRKSILGREDFEELLRDCDCVLPSKRHYYIETIRSQYEHAHHAQDLAMLEKVTLALYPEYSQAFAEVMEQRSLHLWNMFVMKRPLFDAYCEFLFKIFFTLEKQMREQGTVIEPGLFGFLSERLLDVWITKHNIQYKEVPVMFMEKVNWFSKGWHFVKRKFGKR